MKTIGILGGMSWESSSVYYQLLNREVQKRLGGVHSARLLMYSFDFDEMSVLQRAGRWDEANARMAAVAADLARAGADFLVIACNTMHCATPQMAQATSLPLLHIADPLGKASSRQASAASACSARSTRWSRTASCAAACATPTALISSLPKAKTPPRSAA